jgi:hypothetical protein
MSLTFGEEEEKDPMPKARLKSLRLSHGYAETGWNCIQLCLNEDETQPQELGI